MIRTLLLFATFVFIFSACAGNRSQTYVAPSVTDLGVEQAILMRLVEHTARAVGCDVLRSDSSTGTVEAATPVIMSYDTASRERWRINIKGDRVSVNMRLEVKWNGTGQWFSTNIVSDVYGYSREKIFLNKLKARLHKQQSSPEDLRWSPYGLPVASNGI